MFRNLLTLLFFSSVFVTYQAQAQRKKEQENPKDQLIVSFAPLSILEPHTPVFRFGVEYIPEAFNNEWGFKFDYGVNGLVLHSLNELEKESSFFASEYRLETRYYLHPEYNWWSYFSAEVFFIDNNLYNKESYIKTENGMRIEYLSADVMIDTWGFHVKYGERFYQNERFNIDFYTGLGLRYINVSAGNLVYADEGEIFVGYDYFDIFPDLHKEMGLKKRVSVALGVQLAYRL